MNLFPKIGAYLTGGPADEAVLHYAAQLARLNDGEQVYVLGVPEDAELSAEGSASFEERVRAVLREHGSSGLAEASTVHAHEKPSLDEILKATREHDLDLLILGRRLPSNQLGRPSLYPKLVRKVPCSVLLVTQYAEPRFDRILVPVDLSEHSGLAIRLARDLAGTSETGGVVICQRIHAVPYGYAYTGHSREEFAAEQWKNAEEEHRRFLAGLGLGEDEVVCRHSVSEHIEDAVCDMAAAERVNLVIIGSRGHTAATALIMGSTAEKVAGACATPVLVAKRKGETLPFLKALFGE